VPGVLGLLDMKFVGLKNIFVLLTDETYIKSLVNTFIFLFADLGIKMPLALATALAFNRKFVGKRLALALLVIPWALPEIPYYLAMRFIYNLDFGLLPYILSCLGFESPDFLGDPNIAIYSVIAAHVLKSLPFWTLVFLAALQSIPVDLYDASKVDGAGIWDTFRHVTIPMIKNVIIVNYTLSFVWMMGEFNSVWILTRGGPNYASNIISTYAYTKAFLLLELNLGTACFVIIIPLLVLIITLVLRGGLLKLGGTA